ncbi:MAG: pyridoxal phosphate-dependent aminotransferase [Anaerolineaceae bacterium]
MLPSQISQEIPPSGIREVFNRVAESKDVISFALGEPDFNTPKPIIDAAYEALLNGETHYTPNAGLYALRSAIAASYPDRDYAPEQVVVGAGGTESIFLTLLSVVNPGDEVILTEPYWPNYIGQIKTCRGVPKFVRTYEEHGFSLKPEDVEKAITDKTKVIIINSPANPTGAVISKEDLRGIADLVIKHNLIALTDEVYRDILFEGEFASITDFEDVRDHCIVINSFSKTYAMTGWRIGYAIAPRHIAAVMAKMHENSVSCISAFSQKAAIKALEIGKPYIQEMVKEFAVRRDLMVNGIRSIPGLNSFGPIATFYLYFNISGTGLNSRDFVFSLLEKEKVALVPGSAFGNGQENYVRLSFASSQENLRKGLERIANFVHSLNH